MDLRTDADLTHQPRSVERRLAALVGCGEVVAAASGLSALECCLIASGVASGSVVACDALYPFAAMASLNVGGRPTAFDIDMETMVPNSEHLQAARAAGARVVVLTSYFGRRAAVTDVVAEAENIGLTVVEDRAQCFGPHTGPWLGVFSFQQGKFLSCGFGGGVAVPDGISPDPIRRAASLGWWPRTADIPGAWSSGWSERTLGRSNRLPPVAAELLETRLEHAEADAVALGRSLDELREFVTSIVGEDGYVPHARGVRLASVRLQSESAAAELLAALGHLGVVAGRPSHPPVTDWPAFESAWSPHSGDLPFTRDFLTRSVLVLLDSWTVDGEWRHA